MKIHGKIWLSICGLVIVSLFIAISFLSKNRQVPTATLQTEKSSKNAIAEIEKAVVMHNLGNRGSYSSYDATDSLVFFAYTEHAACVDAYNYSGEYQFTISLSHRDRGSIEIRCNDNLLFIDSKYSNVFVFNSDQCIEKLSPDQADNKGYTTAWFQDRTTPNKMGLTKIYRYNTSEEITEISIPSSILRNNFQQYILLCIVLVCFTVKYARNKKSR